MPNTTLRLVRDYDDEIDTERDCAVAATLPVEAASPKRVKKPSGPPCEKCKTPLASEVVTLCKKCGWYPSLGIYMEVDPEWETALDDDEPDEPTPQPNHLQVWINLIPRWGWIIIGSVFAVVAQSIVVRLVTPSGSSLRMYWSLAQLVIGLGVAVNCHVLNFLSQAADDSEVGLLDLLLKPIRLWLRTFHWLPRRLVLVNSAVCGIVAVVMSLVVIGGLPFERLWDWGFKAPPKQNLMGAVMDRVKELDSEGNDNLEGAVKDFAGTQDTSDNDLKSLAGPKPEEKPRQNSDCVILGFQLDRDGALSNLVLGTAYHNRLVFAGTVTPKLAEEEAKELVKSLQAIKSERPLVKVSTVSAFWVRPSYTCRVTTTEQTKEGLLKNIEWDQLLGAMELKK